MGALKRDVVTPVQWKSWSLSSNHQGSDGVRAAVSAGFGMWCHGNETQWAETNEL